MTPHRNRGGSYNHNLIELFDTPVTEDRVKEHTIDRSSPIENTQTESWLRSLDDPHRFLAEIDYKGGHGGGMWKTKPDAYQDKPQLHHGLPTYLYRTPGTWGVKSTLDRSPEEDNLGSIHSSTLFPGVGKETTEYAVKNFRAKYYAKVPARGLSNIVDVSHDADGNEIRSVPYETKETTTSYHVRFPKIPTMSPGQTPDKNGYIVNENSDDPDFDVVISTVPTRKVQTGSTIYGGTNTIVHEIGHALTPNVDYGGWHRSSNGSSPALEGIADGFEDRFGKWSATTTGTRLDAPEELENESRVSRMKNTSYGVGSWTNDLDRAVYLAARTHSSHSDLAHREFPSPKDLGRNWSDPQSKKLAHIRLLGHLYETHPHVRKALDIAGYSDVAQQAVRTSHESTTDASRPSTYQEPLF
jgi:hypothetical protein